MKNISLLFLTLSMALVVDAQIPGTINFQGTLTTPGTGAPVDDGDYSIVFTLFDAPSAGTSVWTETQSVVTVTDGLFNVQLGSQLPLDPSIFSAPLFLEITVGGETLTTRIELASSPYSQAARSVIGDGNNFPSSGNVYIGGNQQVGMGVNANIDLAVDDNDTGLEVPADGTLALHTDGVERMRLDNAGNVGIGTTTPPEKLSVAGNIAATDTVKADVFKYNSGAKISYASVHSSGFTLSTNPTNSFYINSNNTNGYYRWVTGGLLGAPVKVAAPISLPHGATITELRVRVYESDFTYSCTAELIRSGTTQQTEEIIATTNPSTDLGGQVLSAFTIVAGKEIVNNKDFSYAVRINLNSSVTMYYYSATVGYTLSSIH